jgi:tetratricopeptide (TPR) repeat protein
MAKVLLFIQSGFRTFYKNLSLKQTESHLSLIVSLLIRVFGLVLLVFACMLIWRLIENEDYTLEEFTVPKALEESGYTGAYMAQSVQDALHNLKEQAGSSKTDSLHVGNASESDFNVNVMGLDLSIKNIAHQIRLLFGRPVKSIRGELTQSADNMHFTLRVSGFPPTQVTQKIVDNNSEAAIQSLCKQLAESLLGMTDPYRLAVVCYREKRYGQAIECIRKIIKERPHERPWAYLAWGSVLEEQGQVDMAISKYQRATELDSTFSYGWRRWGSSLRGQKKASEAIQKFEKALQLKPDDAQVWAGIAVLYIDTGQLDKSTHAIERALHLASKDPAILLYCAQVKMHVDSVETGKKLLQKTIDTAGETSEGFMARMMLSYLEKDTQGIIANGLYAAELDPKNFTVGRSAMGCAHLQRNYQKAIEIGNNMDLTHPDKEEVKHVYNQLAYAYNMTGQRDSAFAFIRRAIAIDSSYSYGYSTLAEIYAFSGQPEMFYRYLEKGFRLGMDASTIDYTEEPYKTYSQKPRYKALIEKYKKH